MTYEHIYSNFIAKCKLQSITGYSEIHHIIPRSCNGTDSPDNLVNLTIRQHIFAHKLLYKMGANAQIYSVLAFYQDANPNRIAYRQKYKLAKWVRRAAVLVASREKCERNRVLVNLRNKTGTLT